MCTNRTTMNHQFASFPKKSNTRTGKHTFIDQNQLRKNLEHRTPRTSGENEIQEKPKANQKNSQGRRERNCTLIQDPQPEVADRRKGNIKQENETGTEQIRYMSTVQDEYTERTWKCRIGISGHLNFWQLSYSSTVQEDSHNKRY